ncbi:hypothetical protein B0T24DRAFT_691666, partial [Lasiosphaeria ovina]
MRGVEAYKRKERNKEKSPTLTAKHEANVIKILFGQEEKEKQKETKTKTDENKKYPLYSSVQVCPCRGISPARPSSIASVSETRELVETTREPEGESKGGGSPRLTAGKAPGEGADSELSRLVKGPEEDAAAVDVERAKRDSAAEEARELGGAGGTAKVGKTPGRGPEADVLRLDGGATTGSEANDWAPSTVAGGRGGPVAAMLAGGRGCRRLGSRGQSHARTTRMRPRAEKASIAHSTLLGSEIPRSSTSVSWWCRSFMANFCSFMANSRSFRARLILLCRSRAAKIASSCSGQHWAARGGGVVTTSWSSSSSGGQSAAPGAIAALRSLARIVGEWWCAAMVAVRVVSFLHSYNVSEHAGLPKKEKDKEDGNTRGDFRVCPVEFACDKAGASSVIANQVTA